MLHLGEIVQIKSTGHMVKVYRTCNSFTSSGRAYILYDTDGSVFRESEENLLRAPCRRVTKAIYFGQ